MITPEQKAAWEAYSVAEGRKSHSDEKLWESLLELHARQEAVEAALPYLYGLAHSEERDWRSWHKLWRNLCLETFANDELMRLYVWHLEQRQDEAVEQWVADNLPPLNENIRPLMWAFPEEQSNERVA